MTNKLEDREPLETALSSHLYMRMVEWIPSWRTNPSRPCERAEMKAHSSIATLRVCVEGTKPPR